MSLAYKHGTQPHDPKWTDPIIDEWTPELLRDLEMDFGRRGCWPWSIEMRQWLETKFDEKFKDPNYKSQYFGQDEFDRIRKKRGLI